MAGLKKTDKTSNSERLAGFLKETPGGCLEFQGGRVHKYGVFWMNGKNHRAHRAAFELHHGREPNGILLHTCDNPLCCNPSHLSEGTQSDNMADMVRKGRSLKGVRNPMCKFTEEDVVFILTSTMKVKDLAAKFGVSRHTISKWRRKQ